LININPHSIRTCTIFHATIDLHPLSYLKFYLHLPLTLTFPHFNHLNSNQAKSCYYSVTSLGMFQQLFLKQLSFLLTL